jgi:hypothetical protein
MPAPTHTPVDLTDEQRANLAKLAAAQSADANGNAVFNPHNKLLSDLPVIYGFNNGGSAGFLSAVLIAEDGTGLGGHCCSHEYYMPSDLGVRAGSRPDRHEGFQKHYPDGYRMEFVSHGKVLAHPALARAFELNAELAKAADALAALNAETNEMVALTNQRLA